MKLMKKCVDEIFLCGFHYFLCDFRIKSFKIHDLHELE
jgi:hypothetical protein